MVLAGGRLGKLFYDATGSNSKEEVEYILRVMFSQSPD